MHCMLSSENALQGEGCLALGFPWDAGNSISPCSLLSGKARVTSVDSECGFSSLFDILLLFFCWLVGFCCLEEVFIVLFG